jgi:hypothetical protein
MGRNTRYLIIIPAILFALFAKPAKAVEVPPNPYYNPPQNLTVESAPNDGITVKWYPPEVSNYDRIDIYVIEFYRLTDGVESGGWAVWTDSENHAYTFGSWIFNYTGNNLRFKIKAGSDACVGRPDPVGYCLYGTKASVDADATNLPELAPEETTTTWASTTSSTTTTTTSTTIVPSTTVPVTNPTTTTVQETTTTTTVPETTTSVENSTSTTTSSVPQTTTTESTTTTTQPPPTQTSTPPQISEPESVEPYVPEEPEPTETDTTDPEAEEAIPEETLPEETTTTDETYPETTIQTVVDTTLPEATETPLEAPLSDEEVENMLVEAETTEALTEALAELSPEQVEQVVEALLAEEPSQEQAAALATSSEVLAIVSTEQAAQIFEALDVAELSDAQTEALISAVQDASTEIREEFEDTIDIFGEGLDTYVPTGSNIPVGERRTLIAVTAGITLAAAGTRIRR